jgi:aspartyl-tRNA(Asn)/glutamyl-tRNA(Gln) amidotransferase subunit C
MKIGKAEVEYVAKLAQLAITEDEKQMFIGQLNSILEYVEKLDSLDTAAVAPTAQVVSADDPASNLRPDLPVVTFSQELAIANGPASGAGHFKVPKVIDR